jgi:hypothetical protein
MEKYMTDDRSQRARAAAEAGTATRDRAISTAFYACLNDCDAAREVMPGHPSELTRAELKAFLEGVAACQFNGLELWRLIAQRDGYAAAQSIGPDVALTVGGRGR